MADTKSTGYKLPVNPGQQQGSVAQGFVTPKQDRVPQIQSIPPKRVLPIIFIPGIMGSNLRMSPVRQRRLGTKNNIAWRPDNLSVTVAQHNDSAVERQLRLDPRTTELDTYDPINNPTGDPNETADQRNEGIRFSSTYSGFKQLDGPLLQSDLPGTTNPKSKDQKARERGWGEVYFSSYQEILSTCEVRLNSAFSNGSLDVYLKRFVVGIAPSEWQAHPSSALKELDEKTVRAAIKGCWFPVHAMGYNWLRENAESGISIAKRIRALLKRYQDEGFQCEKVILVTHSMGGLVARAVIHPDMGNLKEKVLGVVHGVMPAMGAGAAYKRIRCGFEGGGISTKILGATGAHVTPVLANAQGGLELLPSQAYGNHWLQVKHKGKILRSLPEKGDPYEEIYKVRGKWFGLLREAWVNPANVDSRGVAFTCRLLDRAKAFHIKIAETYHDQSYAHYGADPERPAWHKVIWEIVGDVQLESVDRLVIVSDDAKGKLRMTDPALAVQNKPAPLLDVKLLDPADPGDETVPFHSADAQYGSRKFKAVFRQTGYEHQASYSDRKVVAATLYSLFQIAATMKWSK
jgi:pimeloyl-ACP methyl ester carboxylesterase